MSQKTIVELIDDTDGTIASGTVRFALDHVNYEIDLSDSNAGAMRQTLARYISHARRITGIPVKRNRKDEKAQTERTELREWAAANGIVLSPRGRIPGDVRARWDLARQAAPSPAPAPAASGNGAARPQSPAESPGAAPVASSATAPEGAAEPGSGPRGSKRATAGKRPPERPAQSPAESPGAAPVASSATEPARAAEPGSGPGNGALTGTERATIRAWARLQGIKLGDRGRIPADVIDKFRRAQQGKGPE